MNYRTLLLATLVAACSLSMAARSAVAFPDRISVTAVSHSAGAAYGLLSSASTVDLRRMSEPEGVWHRIDFCARPKDADNEGPGHAFVVFRSHQGEFLAVGYAPEADKYSPLPADGVVSEENFSHAAQRCLEVFVDSNQYSLLRQSVEAQSQFTIGGVLFKVKTKYFVVANDCVGFLRATALELGLKVPPRWKGLYPMDMVNTLIAANEPHP